MTTLLAPSDILGESQRVLSVLERHRAELPYAENILAAHRSTHHDLETSYSTGEQAVEFWRAALAHRWECEVTGRRLYKQVLRQLVEHHGSNAPEIQLLSRGEAEANSSPTELLADLRRIQLALTLKSEMLPFAEQRLAEIERASRQLDRAICEVADWERRRKMAVLEHRLAREAYRRIFDQTRRTLHEHYGERTPNALLEMFGLTASQSAP